MRDATLVEYSERELGNDATAAIKTLRKASGGSREIDRVSDRLLMAYAVGEELGRGRFGVVRRCRSTATGEAFALKSVEKRLLPDALDRACAAREAKIHRLAAWENPHAVQVRAAFEDDEWHHLVMELVEGPDLCDRIAARGGVPYGEAEAAAAVMELARGVACCHWRGVAHRDVKPENVLVDRRGRLKLTDFGAAERFVGPTGERVPMRGLVGTPWYMAPEVVERREYGEKVDVWSLGVIMYLMLSGGTPPFYGETPAETFEDVSRANLKFPLKRLQSVSTAAKDLLRHMLCKEVDSRFSAEQVLLHPWIRHGGTPPPPQRPISAPRGMMETAIQIDHTATEPALLP